MAARTRSPAQAPRLVRVAPTAAEDAVHHSAVDPADGAQIEQRAAALALLLTERVGALLDPRDAAPVTLALLIAQLPATDVILFRAGRRAADSSTLTVMASAGAANAHR